MFVSEFLRARVIEPAQQLQRGEQITLKEAIFPYPGQRFHRWMT